jgi:hypothetical protein
VILEHAFSGPGSEVPILSVEASRQKPRLARGPHLPEPLVEELLGGKNLRSPERSRRFCEHLTRPNRVISSNWAKRLGGVILSPSYGPHFGTPHQDATIRCCTEKAMQRNMDEA